MTAVVSPGQQRHRGRREIFNTPDILVPVSSAVSPNCLMILRSDGISRNVLRLTRIGNALSVVYGTLKLRSLNATKCARPAGRDRKGGSGDGDDSDRDRAAIRDRNGRRSARHVRDAADADARGADHAHDGGTAAVGAQLPDVPSVAFRGHLRHQPVDAAGPAGRRGLCHAAVGAAAPDLPGPRAHRPDHRPHPGPAGYGLRRQRRDRRRRHRAGREVPPPRARRGGRRLPGLVPRRLLTPGSTRRAWSTRAKGTSCSPGGC